MRNKKFQVGKFIQLTSTFLGGFIIAFARGWLLALVLTSCIPALVIAGGFMSLLLAKMSSRGQIAYAQAGNVVEQTIGAIRTVKKNLFTNNTVTLVRIISVAINLKYRPTKY